MRPIIQPTVCPSCNSLLELVNSQLFCRGSDCPAQNSKKLQNFCKKLKLKGFGEATLNKLEMTNINDLLDLNVEYMKFKGFSEHMANKLINVVNSRIEDGITYNEFIAACSVPLIGDGAMRKLKFNTIENITYDLCKEHGIGDKAANSLIEWLEDNWAAYKSWKLITDSSQVMECSKEKQGITVCITGKLNDFKNRAEATTYLEELGFEVKSTVTKTLKYLICEDGTTGSSYKKAQQYNVEILTIKDLEDKFK